MTLNEEVYKAMGEKHNLPWQVVRQIMESGMRLIKKDIESPDAWGCIQFPGIGNFVVKWYNRNKYPDNDLKVFKRKEKKRYKTKDNG